MKRRTEEEQIQVLKLYNGARIGDVLATKERGSYKVFHSKLTEPGDVHSMRLNQWVILAAAAQYTSNIKSRCCKV